jgi:ATP adenylyltransferase
MPIPTLYAPWRMDYIKSLDHVPPGECFLCQAAAASSPEQRRASLVLWDTPETLVVINRYPYSHGHLLIAPKSHKSELGELTEPEGLDLHRQTSAAIELLRRAVSAQGFNIGINIGRVAGAGLPNHVHQHIVPRWNGDANFMSVVGEIHVVPQAISQLYEALLTVRGEMQSSGHG